MTEPGIEDLLRQCAPQVLATLAHRHGQQFDLCEDAVQEALLAALVQWPQEGIPQSPRAWLLTVASRWLIDRWRSDHFRRERETATAPSEALPDVRPSHDDTLTLLFLCCHPALTPSAQIALTLRAVGGLTTTEIAAAFLVPESVMAKRITRAKRAIRLAGARFEPPPPEQRTERVRVVLHVLYLMFNEGYAATTGASLLRADLTVEAIRLTRLLHAILPDHGEAAGLLALMLLTEARRTARTDPTGRLIPLEEQDRSLWDSAVVDEGLALLHQTLGATTVGPYQIQAAIAALHDQAATPDETDWRQILALYDVLQTIAPGPLVRLSQAVAMSHVHGPTAALALIGTLDTDARLAHNHRLDAVRAHLLEQTGDRAGAKAAYERAARAATNRSEQHYLRLRAANLSTVE